MAQGDGTDWLGWEDSNCQIWRRWDARWPGLDQNGGAIAAQYPVQKGLDFRCHRSVSVAMPIRAVWPYLDPAPLAMPPLWGFGGDGA